MIFVDYTDAHTDCAFALVHYTEPTLTLENLISVTGSVQNIGSHLFLWLDIPYSKKDYMNFQYVNIGDQNRAYLDYFLQEHPSPSWMLVGNALWKAEELGPLQRLQSSYLKGKP